MDRKRFLHLFSVSVLLILGQSKFLAGAQFTIAPTVFITSPIDNETVRGTILVSATALDLVGVIGVQFKLDGVNLGAEDTTAPYSVIWDTTATANGFKTITAVARNAAGISSTSNPVSVTVNNALPLITAISPAFGKIGAQVIIHGARFTPTGNSISFGEIDNVATNVSPINRSGTRLPFTIPNTVPCAPSGACPGNPLEPATYRLWVNNANGVTNKGFFAVTDASIGQELLQLALQGKSFMWIGAHLDDAVIISPFLARACKDYGNRCMVVTMSLPNNVPNPVGVFELGQYAALMNVNPIRRNYPNSTQGFLKNGSPQEVVKLWNSITTWHPHGAKGDLLSIIRQHNPDVVITFEPTHGAYGHPDHRATSILVNEVFEENPSIGSSKILYYALQRVYPAALGPASGQQDPLPVTDIVNGFEYSPNLGMTYVDYAFQTKGVFLHAPLLGSLPRENFVHLVGFTWARRVNVGGVSISSSSGDGRVIFAMPRRSGCNLAQWSAAHDATNGNSVDYVNANMPGFAGIACDNLTSTTISRGFLAFDTSPIPDNATIISADLKLFVYGKDDSINDGNDFISVVQGFQSSALSLTNNDYSKAGDAASNPTEGSLRIDITDIVTNAYNAWMLNTDGLSWINKNGFTLLALIEGHDILDIFPNFTAFNATNIINIFNSEQPGRARDPVLEIKYAVPSR